MSAAMSPGQGKEIELLPAGAAPVRMAVTDLVITGWSGRDQAATRAHVDRLVEGGFARPSAIPSFYPVASSLLTVADCIDVVGERTSGEAEVVLFSTAQGLFVGLGSDHTDRELAPGSVARAKQVCAKPISRSVWALDEVAGYWDDITLRAQVPDGAGALIDYQNAPLASILPVEKILRALDAGAGATLPVGWVLFCGTVPAVSGFTPARSFHMTLHDPRRGRRIQHGYRVRALPLVQ